jgi:hypothetical protein
LQFGRDIEKKSLLDFFGYSTKCGFGQHFLSLGKYKIFGFIANLALGLLMIKNL